MMKRTLLLGLLCLTTTIVPATQAPQSVNQKTPVKTQEVKKESKFAHIKTFIYDNKGSIAVALVAGGTVYMIFRKLNAIEANSNANRDMIIAGINHIHEHLRENDGLAEGYSNANRQAINRLTTRFNNSIQVVRNEIEDVGEYIGRFENASDAASLRILERIERIVVPVADVVVPVADVVAPVADVVAPVADVVAPVADVVAPVADVVVLVADVVVPVAA